MGLESRNVATEATMTTGVMPAMFAQFMPEKLPSDQLRRFTMFWSEANVTRKSVPAEAM